MADPVGERGDRVPGVARTPGHVDHRVEPLTVQSGQPGRVVAVRPDEPDAGHRLTRDASGGAGDVVSGRRRESGHRAAEEHGATEYE